MVGTRTYTFQVIGAAIVCLLGFFFGSGAADLARQVCRKEGNPQIVAGGNALMIKRTAAIKKAISEGRDSYDFEVSGFYPPLNTN